MSDFNAGIFEHVSAFDNGQRVATRQAVAVAQKRVSDRFGTFLANATPADRQSRLDLIDEDLREVIAAVASEYDVDGVKLEAALRSTLAGGAFCDDCRNWGDGCECSSDDDSDDTEVKEASSDDDAVEDTDPETTCASCSKSLGGSEYGLCSKCEGESFGDGKESSARVARRPKMCPYHSEVVDISLTAGDPTAGFNTMAQHAWGAKHCQGDFEGGCNFKREMVTQSYWDEKQQQADERREQRELEREQTITEPFLPEVETLAEEPLPEGEGIGTEMDQQLAEAPSAVGGGMDEVVARLRVACNSCNHSECPGDCDDCAECSHKTAADAPSGAGGAVKREKLPTGDKDAQGGPSPKIDKGNSGDERGWNLEAIDTQTEGSPNPTVSQDVSDEAKYDKREFLDQTDAVTDSVDVTQGTETGGQTAPNTDTWSGTEGLADPVTSKVDPDKNPLREILREQFQGFAPANEVQTAIARFERR